MAVQTGTATDHVDLYNKLYDFLTADTDLVAAGQAWTEVWAHPDTTHPVVAGGESRFMLKGPGLSGTDAVYISFELVEQVATDIYGIRMWGHDGVLASSEDASNHLNSSPLVWTPVFPNPMPYWFVANGRRFAAVWKVTTVYEACSAGLFLPFSTPAGYPYPAYVGGSSALQSLRYSDDTYRHTHFVDPGPRDAIGDGGSSVSTDGLSLAARMPGGSWQKFGNNMATSSSGSGARATTHPWAGAGLTRSNFLEPSMPMLGGDYLLTPVTLIVARDEARGALGALDGIYHVPGFGNASENIITVGGVDHLVIQNAFRTDFEGYWALALE